MENKILKIIDTSVEGDGIAREDDNVFFIDGAVEGEMVEASITKQKDNLFWGKLLKIIEPSFRRADAPCPYFEECGGCKLMHFNNDTQKLFKMLSLKRTIKKVTNLDIDVLDTVQTAKLLHYRNSIQLKVIRTSDGEVEIGFYKSQSHELVSIDECLICDPNNKKLISVLKSFLYSHPQLSILSVFATFYQNNLGILVQTDNGQCDSALYNALASEFDKVSLWASRQYNSSTLLNYKEAKFVAGEKAIQIKFGDFELPITPLDFLQVNFDIAQKLYNDIMKIVGTNKVVLDLFSGLGLTSLNFAKNGNFVCSVEQIENSVNTAKELAQKYNLQDRIQAFCGDCTKLMPTLNFSKNELTNLAVFLDPPRKGAGKNVIDEIKKLQPNLIVYMSCNPNSLAKDIRDLLDMYDIQSVQAYDMFPQTNSIESLTVLTKKNNIVSNL